MSYQGTSTYLLKKLDLITNENKTISLVNVFTDIQFTEDIFTNYLHGKLTIQDSNDLHQTAPIIGEEHIELVYNTDGITEKDISLKFRVYRIESSEGEQDRIAHLLYLVSTEAIIDANTLISKAYNGKSAKFIVTDAFTKISNKNINIDEFSNLYQIISPNWSPIGLINYISSIAVPKHYNGSLVMFYENSKGFNFRHIESIIQEEPIGTWSAKNISKNNDKSVADEINPSNNIISHRIIKNSMDTLKSMVEGMYANTTLAYDNITKTYNQYAYNYKKQYNDTIHINQFKLISDNFVDDSTQQKITFVPSTSDRHTSKYYSSVMGNTFKSASPERVLPWRTTMLSQLMAKQIEIVVPGNIQLHAGSIINIEIPNTTVVESQKLNRHRYNTKKVLITKIINKFTRKTHEMTLLACDDSYTDTTEALKEFDRI